MKTTQKTQIIELAPDIKAKYTIARAGQQPPKEGDGVVVEAALYLPAEETYLDSRIQFGHRVEVAGSTLHCYWGVASKKEDFRYCTREFVAARWSEAFAQAEAWARGELQKLADALAARARALQEAED
jgi:hypothetical protein